MQRYRGVGNAFTLDLQPFLGFDGLVKTVGPAPAGLKPARELVDDDNLSFFDYVIFVAQLGDVGRQGVFDVVDQVEVLRVVKIPYLAPPLHLAYAFLA